MPVPDGSAAPDGSCIGNTNYSYATGTETDGSPVWKDLLIQLQRNNDPVRRHREPAELEWGIKPGVVQRTPPDSACAKGITTASYVYDETGFPDEESRNMKTSRLGLTVMRQGIWCMRHGTTGRTTCTITTTPTAASVPSATTG